MDEISQGPKREFRLPSGRWLVIVVAVAVTAGLLAAAMLLVVTGGGGRHVATPGATIALPAAAPSPTAAPGTMLLTCGSATWGSLGPNWRSGSLRAGALWFVAGRQLGYVHPGGSLGADRTSQRPGRLHLVVMIVEVKFGSTVVLKPAPGSRSYFRFWDGFRPGGGNPLPAGDTGFTFDSCPRGSTGPNGPVTDFYLGFSIQAGRAVPADTWTSGGSRPIRLLFTAPGREANS